MNKLIKSAMMMASVGAVLCIVGCGKELTPAEQADKQIVELFSLVADCGGIIPAGAKEAMLGKPEAEKVAMAKKLSSMFPKLRQYGKLVKDANAQCKKLNEDPLVSADKIFGEFKSLVEHPEKIDSEIKEMEEGIEFFLKGNSSK